MSALYKKGKEGFAIGEIDWDTAVIKALLLRGYTPPAATGTPTPSIPTHKFVSDLIAAGATIVATSAALTGKTATDGILDSDDFSFTSVAVGAACPHIAIIQSSAVGGGADVAQAAQRLIGLYDANGLPVTPNGQDILITLNASGLFEL